MASDASRSTIQLHICAIQPTAQAPFPQERLQAPQKIVVQIRFRRNPRFSKSSTMEGA
ncbi:hypothetical protein BIFDEN_00854 [Bifidobacterium dentium ATCC 27678]|nr:hypothetical protein BIFDEN_00854 [Bifidobacterium dentium ATCC 27678]